MSFYYQNIWIAALFRFATFLAMTSAWKCDEINIQNIQINLDCKDKRAGESEFYHHHIIVNNITTSDLSCRVDLCDCIVFFCVNDVYHIE